jgi:hypothetical protein
MDRSLAYILNYIQMRMSFIRKLQIDLSMELNHSLPQGQCSQSVEISHPSGVAIEDGDCGIRTHEGNKPSRS